MEKEPNEKPATIHFSEKESGEYSFKEGVAEAVKRTLSLYEIANHDIIIAINGSGINVGKTALRSNIAKALTERGINIGGAILDNSKSELERARSHSPLNTRKSVYFLELENLVHHSTEEYRKALRGDFFPADLYIAIYRPDAPFADPILFPVADMVIRNQEAKDK